MSEGSNSLLGVFSRCGDRICSHGVSPRGARSWSAQAIEARRQRGRDGGGVVRAAGRVDPVGGREAVGGLQREAGRGWRPEEVEG